jgi:hypothetical protein
MNALGTVKGILFEASDGGEYLLGFSKTGSGPTPILSRRQADGTFSPVEDLREASKVARKELGISEAHLIGPGTGRSLFLWTAFKEALKTFPPVPTWPTWSR